MWCLATKNFILKLLGKLKTPLTEMQPFFRPTVRCFFQQKTYHVATFTPQESLHHSPLLCVNAPPAVSMRHHPVVFFLQDRVPPRSPSQILGLPVRNINVFMTFHKVVRELCADVQDVYIRHIGTAMVGIGGREDVPRACRCLARLGRLLSMV